MAEAEDGSHELICINTVRSENKDERNKFGEKCKVNILIDRYSSNNNILKLSKLGSLRRAVQKAAVEVAAS